MYRIYINRMIQKFIHQYKNMPVAVKAAFAYTVCSILQRSLSFITVPLFTRLLSTEEYGQVNVYGSWQGIMTVLITLQVPFGTFAAAMIKYEDCRDQYTSCAQFFCAVMGAVAMAVTTVFRPWFSSVFELPEYIITLMVGEIVANAATYCWFARERFEYHYRPVIFFTLAQSVTAPLLSFLFVINSEERGYARVAGNSLTCIIFGSAVFIVNLCRGRKLFDREFFKYIIGFNLPLLPYYLSQIVFNASDRIMISSLRTSSEAGIYGIAYSLGMLLNFVLTAVLNSFQPWFFSEIKNKTAAQNKKIITWIALGMAVLVFGIIVTAPEIIMIMAGEKYMDAMWAVPPIAVSLYADYCTSVFLYLDFYYEIKVYMNVATVLAAVINVGLNWILIPHFGFTGAAYTTLASYLVFEVIAYYSYRKVLKQYHYKERIFEADRLFLIQATVTVLGLAVMSLYHSLLIRGLLMAGALALIFSQRDKVYRIAKVIQKKKE